MSYASTNYNTDSSGIYSTGYAPVCVFVTFQCSNSCYCCFHYEYDVVSTIVCDVVVK